LALHASYLQIPVGKSHGAADACLRQRRIFDDLAVLLAAPWMMIQFKISDVPSRNAEDSTAPVSGVV
jgi:hypothetical protein